jgi:hypothetical protein
VQLQFGNLLGVPHNSMNLLIVCCTKQITTNWKIVLKNDVTTHFFCALSSFNTAIHEQQLEKPMIFYVCSVDCSSTLLLDDSWSKQECPTVLNVVVSTCWRTVAPREPHHPPRPQTVFDPISQSSLLCCRIMLPFLVLFLLQIPHIYIYIYMLTSV